MSPTRKQYDTVRAPAPFLDAVAIGLFDESTKAVRVPMIRYRCGIALFLVVSVLAVVGWMPRLRQYSKGFYGHIIGSPLELPWDGPYVHFNFLQLNDVYEVLPLGQRQKGGLARVATVRDWLKKENPNTWSVLSGDALSPSVFAGVKVDDDVPNGRHMLQTLNAMELDFMTFGNHEFDLKRDALLRRMEESNFEWISTNVIDPTTNYSFGGASPYKILHVQGVRILLLGLCLDQNEGMPRYVTITHDEDIVPFTRSVVSHPALQGSYDVLVALTHLKIPQDVALARSIPEIDLIIGGHEHDGWYLWRGPNNTPIIKTNSNAATVMIHRMAFNKQTGKVIHKPTLVSVDESIPEEPKTSKVANFWHNLGVAAFRKQGFVPEQVVIHLPQGVMLDARVDHLRAGPSVMADKLCKAQLAALNSEPIMGTLNVGLIRVDDVLSGTITEYDILRTLPFPNHIVALRISGSQLVTLMDWGHANIRGGMYMHNCGVERDPKKGSWILPDGTKIENRKKYTIATNEYILKGNNSPLAGKTEPIETSDIYSKAFIRYLRNRKDQP